MDITLTPFKRRYVENWRKDVQKHLEEGSICRIVVTQINSDDEENSEACPKPTTPLPPPSGNRAKQVLREKTPTEKLADIAVSSSLHIQALPSVRFMYTNAMEQKKNSEKLYGGIPVNGRQNLRKEVQEVVNVTEDQTEAKPLVIVDPQLMTPLEHPDLSTQENKKPSSKDVRFPMKITPLKPQVESKKYNRLPIFAKCKIQSTERNSFVVSRSNFLKNGKAKNHSFLTLPVRFQVQAQTNDRLIQSSENYILREKSNFTQTPRIESRRSPRKVDFPLATPRVASNTIWAW
ncbi:uncharacterized protein LOC125653903 [Ostrea edulis]|uniref:uncharacterized protein LOC125653903 n=1 Tax=Ostrea edulis TaxID=37623 RepID=UPI0024AF3F45|nr:uncharacterized protein LOC125653903 [Ostrea edulis]XP_056000415.1 uncharacterized protein LOC125653903 [Ostrea edulis]